MNNASRFLRGSDLIPICLVPDGLAARHFLHLNAIDLNEVVILESVQKDILTVLLGRVFALGLISESTYKSARNSLASSIDLPEILWYPVCPTGEGETNGGKQNSG
jgi:hypothetical protein